MLKTVFYCVGSIVVQLEGTTSVFLRKSAQVAYESLLSELT